MTPHLSTPQPRMMRATSRPANVSPIGSLRLLDQVPHGPIEHDTDLASLAPSSKIPPRELLDKWETELPEVYEGPREG
jgi:hypothetical protein